MTDPFDIALARGASLFNAGDYVGAYEAWYAHWSEEESADADLLQGLLQVAVAFAKHQGGDPAAARKLLASARTKLGPYAPVSREVDVAGLLVAITAWDAALAAAGTAPPSPRVNRVERPRVRVVAGLFRRGDTVLAQRRPAGKARAGLWEFPGGKVEAGESDPDALARECREELGVTVVSGERVFAAVHEYDDLTVELSVYHATLPEGAEPEARDPGSELRWVKTAELADLEFCPADQALIEQLVAGG